LTTPYENRNALEECIGRESHADRSTKSARNRKRGADENAPRELL
jgi:hypothetical protein